MIPKKWLYQRAKYPTSHGINVLLRFVKNGNAGGGTTPTPGAGGGAAKMAAIAGGMLPLGGAMAGMGGVAANPAMLLLGAIHGNGTSASELSVFKREIDHTRVKKTRGQEKQQNKQADLSIASMDALIGKGSSQAQKSRVDGCECLVECLVHRWCECLVECLVHRWCKPWGRHRITPCNRNLALHDTPLPPLQLS